MHRGPVGLLLAPLLAFASALPVDAIPVNRAVLSVTGGVSAECSVTLDSEQIVADIFPISGLTRTTGRPRVSYACTRGVSVMVSGRGANLARSCAKSSGALRSPSGDVLCYDLFDGAKQLSMTSSWTTLGTGTATSFFLNFAVASSPTVREGTYTDTYTLTFTAS